VIVRLPPLEERTCRGTTGAKERVGEVGGHLPTPPINVRARLLDLTWSGLDQAGFTAAVVHLHHELVDELNAQYRHPPAGVVEQLVGFRLNRELLKMAEWSPGSRA
jgi:hypothetical protein